MSLKILGFREIVCPDHILFDQVDISIKFRTIKLQVCRVKQADFEHIRHHQISSHRIDAKVKVPLNFEECIIYVHPTIINMSTTIEAIKINLQSTSINDNCLQICTQTDLGPFHLEIQQEHEIYLSTREQSLADSSVASISDMQDTKTRKEEKICEKSSTNSAAGIGCTEQKCLLGASTKSSSNVF